MNKIVFSLVLLFLISCKQEKKTTSGTSEQKNLYTTIGNIERLNPKLDELIDSTAKIEVLATGYNWSEGPLWLEKQQALIWSDVPENTIYRWKEGYDAQVFLTPSGYTGQDQTSSGEPGSNGLVLTTDGQLILCQHGDRRIAIMNAPLNDPKPNFSTLAITYKGKKLNSPNDAVFDNAGNLYFTDPPYGLSALDESEDKELEFNGVYKLDNQGNLEVMVDSLTKPNGITFNQDFTQCYVANSDPKKAYWAVYDINAINTFTNGRVFFDATTMVASKKGLPDGLKIDNKGNVFATGPGGVLIFSPNGEHLGTINTGQATSNCAFNSDKSVLFMTADNYILRLQLKTN